MSDSLMLLDSASLYFRAFYGVPVRRAGPDQTPVNAVRGFLDMIATLVSAHSPTHLVACWDDDWRPAWRVDLIPSYKTHRLAEGTETGEESPDDLTPQVPIIVSALAALGIARIGAPGYEADDVIGTLAARHSGTMPVRIVTGDRDLLQLIDDANDVRVLYTGKGGVREPDLGDEGYLRDRYGVSSGEAYLDLAVLRGDASDGLPGVKGVGEKTAVALLEHYGTLAAIRAAIDSGDPWLTGARRRNLEAASDYLDVAPTVVRVAADAPVPEVSLALPREAADPGTLEQLVDAYDLASPTRRVLDALARRP